MDDQVAETVEEAVAKAKVEAKAEGSNRMWMLVMKLQQDNRTEDIAKLNADKDFYRSMLEYYHIV